jgi:hypothetical protein
MCECMGGVVSPPPLPLETKPVLPPPTLPKSKPVIISVTDKYLTDDEFQKKLETNKRKKRRDATPIKPNGFWGDQPFWKAMEGK